MSLGGTATLLFITFTSVLITDTSALSCDWSGGNGKLEGYIPGNPSTVSVTNGARECRDQCMRQSTFICAAVNYRASDGVCELMVENNQTAFVVEPFDGSWLYFIRPLCAGIWLPWTAKRGKYITGSSFSDSTTNNLQDCMTSCMRDPSGGDECRGINIHTSSDSDNCKLRSDNAEQGVSYNLNWQYFNRPIWYSESSIASTLADIRDQGTIAYYLNIYTALTIPADGYLVAWQYYMKTLSPCPTYVSIWRPNDDASIYTLISNTLLAPEEPSTEGVRFQYIQNETIRVQKHDVLSVHVDRIDCDNNIVSVDNSVGNERISIENDKKLDINTTRGCTTDANAGVKTKILRATPAMKAYVSAYLSLDGTPQTYHNTSLSSGQIWLKLPPLLTTEESVVVAGYKVICSTDVNLSPLVSCYYGLVPVNSRDVLLNLPDVTRTYHVSVQIARNFNDTELLDDKYSPVSSAFCTERYKTYEVTISESIPTSADSKPNVTVTLQHVFQADEMCAKEIKLNYSAYDTDYKTIDNNLQREYILQLEQGTTYELTIYLKLTDGAEIVFWTQEYTTSSVTTTTSSTSTTTTKSTGVTEGIDTTAGSTLKSNGASDKTDDIDSTSGETTQSYFKEYKTYQAAVIGVGVVAVLGIACSLAFTIHCIIRKRRLASAADEGKTEMEMKETGKAPRKDKTKGLPDAELPIEYEVVHSPPAGTSNEYERVDLPSEVKTGEYEVVGTSHPHVYEGLSLR